MAAPLIPKALGDSLIFKSLIATIEKLKNSNFLLFESLADMKAEMSSGVCTLKTVAGSISYSYVAGDFTGQANDVDVIQLDNVLISQGALVRTPASSISFRQIGSLFYRSLLDKTSEILSVVDYGAKGDGVTNDSAKITLADSRAAAKGKSLFFPAGIYMVDPLVATTNWYGEPGSILMFRSSPSTFVAMVTASKDNIVFDGLTFDGNCSEDPVIWTRASQDGFTGAAGLSIENCKRPKVINCSARNMRQHGFRFNNCDGAVWRDLDVKRCRGNFGDAYIAISCVNLTITSCYADDYTRIGFVVDSFGDTVITCHKIAISNCFARNGHHASYLYGGSEFNAGFWLEHTGDVSMDGCFASDNTHRGINVCTGSKNNNFPGNHAIITINNCHTVGSEWGIITYSLGDLAVVSKVANSSSKLAGTAFEGVANVSGDSFSWLNCHADYNAASSARWGFSCQVNIPGGGNRPLFHVGQGCTISRWAEDLNNLRDAGANAATADIGGYYNPNIAMRLSIDGVRHVKDDNLIYVRWYENTGLNHSFSVSNTDVWISRGGTTGGVVRIQGCTVHQCAINQGSAFTADIKNSNIIGLTILRAAKVNISASTVTINDTGYLWLLSDEINNSPAVFIDGVRFDKNVTDNGEILRLGFGMVSFQAIILNSFFYNLGSTTTTKAFITYAAGTVRRFSNCYSDKRVTNITKLDSNNTFEDVVPGVTPIDMH